MRYQAGRAFAVAGHKALCRELGLLHDVSIPGEGRETGEKGRVMYQDIMPEPFHYDSRFQHISLNVVRA